MSSSLGSAIRNRRLKLGLTQEQLAERISADGEYVRQSEISRLESGAVGLPRRARLERLATALDLTIGDLLAASGWATSGNGLPENGHQDAPLPQPPGVAASEDDTLMHDEPPTTADSSDTTNAHARTEAIDRRDRMDIRRGEQRAFDQAIAQMRSQLERLEQNRRVSDELMRRIDDSREARDDSPGRS